MDNIGGCGDGQVLLHNPITLTDLGRFKSVWRRLKWRSYICYSEYSLTGECVELTVKSRSMAWTLECVLILYLFPLY